MRYKDYNLELEEDRFNLYNDRISENGNPYKSYIGYSYRFGEVIQKIAALEAAKGNPETIRDYIDEYNRIVQDIKTWLE